MIDQEEFKKNLRHMNLSEKQIRDLITNLSGQKLDTKILVCKHFNTKSDYMGSTCTTCNKITTGRGFGGVSINCIHVFEILSNGKEECTYCGEQKFNY